MVLYIVRFYLPLKFFSHGSFMNLTLKISILCTPRSFWTDWWPTVNPLSSWRFVGWACELIIWLARCLSHMLTYLVWWSLLLDDRTPSALSRFCGGHPARAPSFSLQLFHKVFAWCLRGTFSLFSMVRQRHNGLEILIMHAEIVWLNPHFLWMLRWKILSGPVLILHVARSVFAYVVALTIGFRD